MRLSLYPEMSIDNLYKSVHNKLSGIMAKLFWEIASSLSFEIECNPSHRLILRVKGEEGKREKTRFPRTA